MQHECKITVIDKKCFTDFQKKYLAAPKSGPCPFFNVGDEFVLKRTPKQDDFYHLMGKTLRTQPRTLISAERGENDV